MSYNTYLSLDIGPHQTKAWLFDNQTGAYVLRGVANAQTMLMAGGDVRRGVNLALDNLQRTTGARLLDAHHRVTLRGKGAETGLDGAGLSFSAGEPIRTVLIGVSESYSIEALRRLVSFFDTQVVLEVNLQDDLNATAQLEKLISNPADLYVIAGGVDGGAERSVRAAIENIRLIYHQLSALIHPQVIYAGNANLAEYAGNEIEAGEDFHSTGNIQPVIGKADVVVAWQAMLSAFTRIREQQFPGLKALQDDLKTHAIPTLFSINRTVRLLDKINSHNKGIMALAVGEASTGVVVSKGDEQIAVEFQAEASQRALALTEQLASLPIESEVIKSYLSNKTLHPAFLPATLEDQAIEQAWARVQIREALSKTAGLFADLPFDPQMGLWRSYEPIILTGEALARMPKPGDALLMAADGLLPHGITTFVLDPEGMLVALGTAMALDPLLPIQVIDSNCFLNLATLVSVDNPEHAGRKILQVEVDRGTEPREHLQVLKSEIKRIEISAQGKTRVYLSPNSQSNVGMGLTGLGGWVTVFPSEVGVVIDARGRPLELLKDKEGRSRQIKDWSWELDV